MVSDPTEEEAKRIARRLQFVFVAIAKLRQRRHTATVHVRVHPSFEPHVASIGEVPLSRHVTVPPGVAWVIDTARTPWDRIEAPIKPS